MGCFLLIQLNSRLFLSLNLVELRRNKTIKLIQFFVFIPLKIDKKDPDKRHKKERDSLLLSSIIK